MFFKLFLIFTIIPLIELAIIIELGRAVGTLNTVLIVVGTAILGAYLVRLEGINVIYRFRSNIRDGVFPAGEIFDGAILLVAGAVLITPGLVTDILGLLLVLPPSREIIKRLVKRYIERKFLVVI